MLLIGGIVRNSLKEPFKIIAQAATLQYETKVNSARSVISGEEH